jgi:hypothetical protein
MTNTAGNSADAGYGAPSTDYGWYPVGHRESEPGADRLTRSLWSVVAVLGLASFAVSFASPVALGFPVRLSVFAAIVAAVGLLRGQAGRGWIVVALTVTAFLEAAASWVRSGETGWVLTVIMVLNALQALAAVGALLQETRTLRSADSVSTPDYSAYDQLVTAYQAYATQYQQQSQPPAAHASSQAQGEGTASADATAPSRAPVSADQDALAALQARYAQHGVGPAQEYHGSPGPAPATPVARPGTPGVDRSAPSSQPYDPQLQSPGQASSI